jgi:prepilin-type N-terminal cleavage/methylation domain-containing protein
MMVGMMKHRNKIKSAGFSLVEMAIVVTIMGVLAGGVLAVSSNKIEKTALRTTAQKINDVDDAIKAYYSRYGFIPCPASPTAQENTATFGFATNCAATVIAPSGTWEAGSGSDTIRGGVVPTRTLGLPDSAMYDEWGNRLSYAAIKAMTLTRTGYTTFTTSLTTGVIQMVDMNGNQLLDPSTKNIIPYVIISHGKDKKGAFGRKIAGMTPQVACGSVAKDSENCDFGDPNSNDAVFMDTSLSDSQTARDYFYDIVKWRATKALERDAHGVAKINDFISFPTVDGVSGGSIVDNGCLIKLDGTLWCWGENINGLLGNGTMTDAFRPIAVSGGGRWKKMPYISANAVHFCAIKVDDSLWCWGGNGTGALGNGTTTTSTVPVAVSGGGQWKSVHIRGGATCAIKSDSTLWCWGYNSVIPLGDGTTTDRYVPTQIAAGSTWKSLSISQYNMCGIKSDDTLWCWGSVVIGSGLGNGAAVGSLVPVQVSGTWKQVQPTLTHTCAIKSDDTLWCWGNNVNGAVGDGTNTNRLIPVQVSGGGHMENYPNQYRSW